MTWIDYEPFNNKSKNTLWELARMIVDQYLQDNPDIDPTDEKVNELIQSDGVPTLARWLFKNPNIIDTSLPEWDEFIKQFFQRFLNREVNFMTGVRFRSYLIRYMVEFKQFVEDTAQKLYSEIGVSSSTLVETSNRQDTDNIISTGNRNLDRTENSQSETNETSDASLDTTSKEDSTVSNKTKSDATTVDVNSMNDTSTSRQLESELPQSIVDQATIGNPDTQTWKYGTRMTDKNDKATKNTTNNQSIDSQIDNDITSTTNGTQDNATHTEIETDVSIGNDVNETTATTDTTSKTGTGATTATRQANTDLQANIEKYNFFIANMKQPIFKVLDEMDILFNGIYLDESDWEDADRMGELNWNSYNGITSKMEL